MKKLIFIISLLLVILSSTIVNATFIQWKYEDGGNDHWYEAVYVPQGITWNDADLAAVTRGGYLATINTVEENEFVFNLIKDSQYWFVDTSNNSLGPYLGGYQLDGQSSPSEGWQWTSGETWSYTNWWPSREPNDANGTDWIEDGTENFLQFYNVGNINGNPVPASTWNDIPNSYGIKGYIIENHVNPVPEPSSCLLLLSVLLGMVGVKKKFS